MKYYLLFDLHVILCQSCVISQHIHDVTMITPEIEIPIALQFHKVFHVFNLVCCAFGNRQAGQGICRLFSVIILAF
jgi:hypothetical protein